MLVILLLPPPLLLLRFADAPPLLGEADLLVPLFEPEAALFLPPEELRLADDEPPPLLDALRPLVEDDLDATLEAPPWLDAPFFDALPRLEEDVLLADELLDALPLPELLEAPLLAPPRLPEVLPAAPRDEPPLRDAPLDDALRPDDFDADLLAPPLEDFDAAFLGAAFLEAVFLEAVFFEAVFFEAVFEELPLPEDEPPLEEEPPRPDDLAAPFFDAPFAEDLPPELLLADFFEAAFLVDFAIVNEI